MPDLSTTKPPRSSRRKLPPRSSRGKRELRLIQLPNGETLEPRRDFARERLGVSDKTAQRMHLPGRLVGGIAYVAVQASLKVIADGVKRRNQPPPSRRGGSR